MLEGRRFFLVPHRALPDLQRMKLCGRLVGPGEFRVRSLRDEAIHAFFAARWIASRSLSSGAPSRDPLAPRKRRPSNIPHQPPIA